MVCRKLIQIRYLIKVDVLDMIKDSEFLIKSIDVCERKRLEEVEFIKSCKISEQLNTLWIDREIRKRVTH